VVCGGGTGAGLMRELADAGYEVSAGVLNALDTDEETGRDLGLHMAVEAPFSPVGDEADAENRELMRRADLVIVSAVPVSHGNARNIAAAVEAAAAGMPVWAAEGVLADDFAGVTGDLAPAGVRFFADDAALLAELRRRGSLRTPAHQAADGVESNAGGSGAGEPGAASASEVERDTTT
jgi:hypothetical protein